MPNFITTTAAILGRGKLEPYDIDRMPLFTSAHLRGAIVYIVFVVVRGPDGRLRIWHYVGSSVRQDGAGKRLIGDYEHAVRHASNGRYHSGLGASKFLAAAAQPNTRVLT